MNIGQRPLSVGEEETHMSLNIVTRDNNLYIITCIFIFTHAYLGHSPENWTKEGAAFPKK